MSREKKTTPKLFPGIKPQAIRVLCPKCRKKKIPLNRAMCSHCEYVLYQKGKSFAERPDHDKILVENRLKYFAERQKEILSISDHCSCCNELGIEFLTIIRAHGPASVDAVFCFNCAHAIRVNGICPHKEHQNGHLH